MGELSPAKDVSAMGRFGRDYLIVEVRITYSNKSDCAFVRRSEMLCIDLNM